MADISKSSLLETVDAAIEYSSKLERNLSSVLQAELQVRSHTSTKRYKYGKYARFWETAMKNSVYCQTASQKKNFPYFSRLGYINLLKTSFQMFPTLKCFPGSIQPFQNKINPFDDKLFFTIYIKMHLILFVICWS